MVFALSYPVDVSSFPRKGFDLLLKTDAKERCKLADNHGLPSVDEFLADFRLRRWKKRGIRLQGCITASVIQKCVITAEFIENHITQTVDMIYIPQGSQLAKFFKNEGLQEILLDTKRSDRLEIFEGKEIDVGNIAEEFFELSIDPYPRKRGAFFKRR